MEKEKIFSIPEIRENLFFTVKLFFPVKEIIT